MAASSGLKAMPNEVSLDRLGAALRQRPVDIGRAGGIGMAFNPHDAATALGAAQDFSEHIELLAQQVR